MRSCPLFEHLLSPSLNNEIFQIENKKDSIVEEKYFQVNKKHNKFQIKEYFFLKTFQSYNESQRNVIAEAVAMVRDAKDDDQAKIYMCQGPPGTGN